MHLLVGGHERAWIENCVCGLGRLEKTLNFLRCILVIELVLKCGSDIIERNWLDLFFHIILLIGIVASVFKTSFSSCILGFRLKFSIIALWRSRLQLDSKSDLTATGFFWSFMSDYASSRRLHIWMDWNLDELLLEFSFLMTSSFFDV